MKAAPFDFVRPVALPEALDALFDAGARVLAGGQSLGPMLNLRVVQPARLVQVNHLPELATVYDAGAGIRLGACITHAAIAAGRTPDVGGGILARVAGAIAYQAVRNRGTIGGSVVHADPAADWVTVLTALDASVTLRSAGGTRQVSVAGLIAGAYATTLRTGEILTEVGIPYRPTTVGWGYEKACRKPGAFAHAMAAVLIDGATRRLVIGATGGKPLLLTGPEASLDGARAALAQCVGQDVVDRHMHLVVVHRALRQAESCIASP